MSTPSVAVQDVMQVCRNGHVITDLLRTCPERALAHCDRCGAVTLDRCSTCGRELPGALVVPGLQPVGVRQAPSFCSTCGAVFPWTKPRHPPKLQALAVLEAMLRRLPRVMRELRVRQTDRPAFRITDERDLEDLVRALLPLHFDDIRPECRTPSYAACTRMDFLLAAERIALAVKFTQPTIREQLQEDSLYYRRDGKCRTLVGFVYDPEASIRDAHVFESSCSAKDEDFEVRCVVAAP
jgi:hypothetical protein